MTTEAMLEALSKVYCSCFGHDRAPAEGEHVDCHGTGRMFWRLAEECLPYKRHREGFDTPARDATGTMITCEFCNGSGYRLIQHDLLSAVLESIADMNEIWWLLPNSKDVMLSAAVSELFELVSEKGVL